MYAYFPIGNGLLVLFQWTVAAYFHDEGQVIVPAALFTFGVLTLLDGFLLGFRKVANQ